MSIILKGIDIPKCSNEDCIVVIRHDKAEVWQTGYKEQTVEAIQIPTPHGRLIDFDRYLEHTTRITEASSFAEIIFPTTILEAEE